MPGASTDRTSGDPGRDNPRHTQPVCPPQERRRGGNEPSPRTGTCSSVESHGVQPGRPLRSAVDPSPSASTSWPGTSAHLCEMEHEPTSWPTTSANGIGQGTCRSSTTVEWVETAWASSSSERSGSHYKPLRRRRARYCCQRQPEGTLHSASSLAVAPLAELPGSATLVIDDGTDHPTPPIGCPLRGRADRREHVRDFGRFGRRLYVLYTRAADGPTQGRGSGGTATVYALGGEPTRPQRARGATRRWSEGPQRLPPHAPAHRAAHARATQWSVMTELHRLQGGARGQVRPGGHLGSSELSA